MSLFEIKNRFTGAVIFSLECGSLSLCVEAAVMSRADLSGADLSGADLSGADLSGAYLSGADLSGADLSRAKYGDGVPLEYEPLQLSGTKYLILIMDTYIKIGCKLHSYYEWSNLTDEQIRQMDSGALEWWDEWRGMVLSLSLGHQQRIAAKKDAK